jgi:plastocyanin
MVAAASALVLGGLSAPAVADGGGDGGPVTVVMQDRCDPATFNAALGDGFCVAHHDGGVVLDKLFASIAQDPAGVMANREVRGWRFHPDHVTLRMGQGLVLANTGGETHTFTPVAMYGLGCVDGVNAFFDNLGLVSVCGPNAFDSAVAPGHTSDPLMLGKGMYRFECMVHPWMRTDVTVR